MKRMLLRMRAKRLEKEIRLLTAAMDSAEAQAQAWRLTTLPQLSTQLAQTRARLNGHSPFMGTPTLAQVWQPLSNLQRLHLQTHYPRCASEELPALAATLNISIERLASEARAIGVAR